MKTFWILLIAAFLVVGVGGQAFAQDSYSDSLKGETLNQNWVININPNSGEVVTTTDGVELTMYPNNSGNYSLGGQSIRLDCDISGDFDAQYDFELVNWPTRNGIRLGLNISGIGAVERVSGDLVVIYGNREVYLTHFPNGIRGIRNTTDTHGKLRFTRTGNLVRGYFWNNANNSWVLMNTSGATTATLDGIYAAVWGHIRTLGITARITNFSIVADSLACPYPQSIPVTIDIKPWSDPNSINVRSKGVIPVAILTDENIDATTIDPASLVFATNSATIAHSGGHIEDVDLDGDNDLVVHFYTDETGIACGDTEATLIGATYDGQAIDGSDAVRTVGCKK